MMISFTRRDLEERKVKVMDGLKKVFGSMSCNRASRAREVLDECFPDPVMKELMKNG